MVNAPQEALKALRAWFAAAQSRMKQVVSGNGIPGHRAGPTQASNNDAKIGARLDYGERFEQDGKGYQRVNFQLNKGAERTTIRELANKDPHKVWASADIRIDTAGRTVEEAFDELFDDLDKDIRK